jgi:hypothetical protein
MDIKYSAVDLRNELLWEEREKEKGKKEQIGRGRGRMR